MAIFLRDYQQEAINCVIDKDKAGVKKQIIALPCGSGKTIIFSAIAKHYNVKTLVLAHRDELLTQARSKFKVFWPKVSIGYCNAKEMDTDKQILIGSVSSCHRDNRLLKLKYAGIKLLIIDEAHHSLAKTYRKIIDTLGADLLIGVTATPERSDKQALDQVFDEIVFSRSISRMIKEGWLCPVQARKISTKTKLDDVHIRMGDFALDELDKAINTNERNELIVEKFKEHADGRKAVAFCSSVDHCKELAEEFRNQGYRSQAIFGAMPTVLRKRYLTQLKKGSIDVVTSCNVLTEGFDEPSVDCIIMARPTKSRPLYVQCCGRGLRNSEGKKDCMVLDFIDKDHRLRNKLTLKGIIPEVVEVIDDPEAREREEREKLYQEEERQRRERYERIRKEQIEDRKLNLLAKEEEEAAGKQEEVQPSLSCLYDGEWSFCSDQKYEAVFTPKKFNPKGFEDIYTAVIYDPTGRAITTFLRETTIKESFSRVLKAFKKNKLTYGFHNFYSSWFKDALKVDHSDKQRTMLLSIIPETNIKKIEELITTNEFLKSKAGLTVAITSVLALKRKIKRYQGRILLPDMYDYLLAMSDGIPADLNKLS